MPQSEKPGLGQGLGQGTLNSEPVNAYPMSYTADRLSITLPLYYGMTEEEQIRVVTRLKSLLISGHRVNSPQAEWSVADE